MKNFKEAELEVIMFSDNDVIATSAQTNPIVQDNTLGADNVKEFVIPNN